MPSLYSLNYICYSKRRREGEERGRGRTAQTISAILTDNMFRQ